MKHYTSSIPLELAERLKEKGMPITISNLHQIAPNVKVSVQMNFKEIDCPTYASTFDWLMAKEISVSIIPFFATTGFYAPIFVAREPLKTVEAPTWHEAAEKAIEKALTLI